MNNAMTAYLLQVDPDSTSRIGKKTLKVEYENRMEVNGKEILNTSVTYCQFYLNYSGLSYYR